MTRRGPVIVLMEPQLGENIGAVARAMLNCGLDELRLVRPRDGWPSEKARAAASGADRVCDAARVFDSLDTAIGDLGFLVATSARPRGMVQRVVDARQGAALLHARAADGVATGVLFGPEATGLTNDDLTAADVILDIPLNPDFASLNIAQAVMIVAYEWYLGGRAGGGRARVGSDRSPPAAKGEILALFSHLEAELDAAEFFRNPKMRPTVVRNLRNALSRAGLSEAETRTLRGVVKALSHARKARARRE